MVTRFSLGEKGYPLPLTPEEKGEETCKVGEKNMVQNANKVIRSH